MVVGFINTQNSTLGACTSILKLLYTVNFLIFTVQLVSAYFYFTNKQGELVNKVKPTME